MKYAIRIVFLALPFWAGASATTGIPDLLDGEVDRARADGSEPSKTWSEPTMSVVEVTIPPAVAHTTIEHPLSANPLWAMPIKQFNLTRERPVFLPSRRPPAPPPSTVTVAKVVAPPKPKEPEQPRLSLVGTISGDDDKFGIFVDEATRAVLRLRVGEEFQGWKLQSVNGREVTFQKDQQSFVVALPQPGLSQPTVVVREAPTDTRLAPLNLGQPRGGRH